jgi:hypothetical protein
LERKAVPLPCPPALAALVRRHRLQPRDPFEKSGPAFEDLLEP